MPVVLGFRTLDGEPLPTRVDGGKPVTEHTARARGRESAHHRRGRRGGRAVAAARLLGAGRPRGDDARRASRQRWWCTTTTRSPAGGRREELMIRVVDAHRLPVTTAAARARVGRAGRRLCDGWPPPSTTRCCWRSCSPCPTSSCSATASQQIDVDGVAAGLDHLRLELGTRPARPAARRARPVRRRRRRRRRRRPTSARAIARRAGARPAARHRQRRGGAGVAHRSWPVAEPDPCGSGASRSSRTPTTCRSTTSSPTRIEQWQHAPKLVDRWLRAQSGARRSDTIERVAALARRARCTTAAIGRG